MMEKNGMNLYDHLPTADKAKIDETNRKLANGEWVSNSDAQRAHNSTKSDTKVSRDRRDNGFC